MNLVLQVLLLLSPGLLFSFWALWLNYRARRAAGTRVAAVGFPGAKVAALLLNHGEVAGADVEAADGYLCNHYVAGPAVIRLHPANYRGRTLRAVAAAAHEVGHALQEKNRYSWLALREVLVPWCGILGNAAWIVLIVGVCASLIPLILFGAVFYSLSVLLQLVILPVEMDANRRGFRSLQEAGLVQADEEEAVRSALRAAAWSPVATTFTSFFTLRFLLPRKRPVANAQ